MTEEKCVTKNAFDIFARAMVCVGTRYDYYAGVQYTIEEEYLATLFNSPPPKIDSIANANVMPSEFPLFKSVFHADIALTFTYFERVICNGL